jgi:hypothetical protein
LGAGIQGPVKQFWRGTTLTLSGRVGVNENDMHSEKIRDDAIDSDKEKSTGMYG